MTVRELRADRFRNLEPLRFSPGEGVNILYGANAQGKTNVLEALWLFTGAKSFRGAKDRQMVRFGAADAALSCFFSSGGREQSAEIRITDSRVAERNGVPLKTPGELAGYLRAVIFSPTDLALVNEGPGARRKFLDLGIGFLYPAYIEKLRRYGRVLRQRNALLKTVRNGGSGAELFEDFDAALSSLGAEITRYRTAYTVLLQAEIPAIFGGMSGGAEELCLSYETTGGCDAAAFRQKLAAGRADDIRAQTTALGPHRDDCALKINEKPAKLFASQGQRRSVALALKLAQAAVIRGRTGERPTVLLDDLFSELDASRQRYLYEFIRSGQVFITCCEPAPVRRMAGGRVFRVNAGTVSEE